MLKQLGFNNLSTKLLLLVFLLTLAIIASIFITKPKNQNESSQIPIAPKDQPSDRFNTTETQYKEAYPQQFFNQENTGTGSLIVDSNPPGARVLIDSPEEEVTSPGILNPVNTTPFKISSLPVGNHNLFAFLEGYNFTEEPFTITAGQVTRIMFQLSPQEQKVGY